MKWHYTHRRNLELILASGVIKLSDTMIDKGEKPAVWFSSNPLWEATVNKLWQDSSGNFRQLSKEETHRLSGGLCRIAVNDDVAPINWHTFKRTSGASSRMTNAMYSDGVSKGARPAEWYCTFSPVHRDQWLAVEVWTGEAWIAWREES